MEEEKLIVFDGMAFRLENATKSNNSHLYLCSNKERDCYFLSKEYCGECEKYPGKIFIKVD